MALIPFDVALGGLNSIASIFGANEQDRLRQRQMEEAVIVSMFSNKRRRMLLPISGWNGLS